MKSLDGRKIDHKTLEELRIQAIKRVEEGQSLEEVIRTTGFSRACIYNWIARYRQGGMAALKAKALNGRPPRLSNLQTRKLFEIITKQNPIQLDFDQALWTRPMVRALIKKKYRVKLSDGSVGRMLRRMGFTPRRPCFDERRLHTYGEQSLGIDPTPSAQIHTFTQLKKLASKKNAKIFYSNHRHVSDFSKVTELPTEDSIHRLPCVQTHGVNTLSAVNAQGQLRFMGYEGRLDVARYIEFLDRLIYNTKHTLFLFIENKAVFRAPQILQFAQTNHGLLHLYYFEPNEEPELEANRGHNLPNLLTPM